MFTGIVEEIGILNNINVKSEFSEIEIKCTKVLDDTQIGDSICTNGICLTVKEKSKDSFKADVMKETLDKTSLGKMKSGDELNLERALKVSDRFGGHIVSGHIDGYGEIASIKESENGVWFTIYADHSILKYIIYKGSITIDGISLTVAHIEDNYFKVSVIPHTIINTNLRSRKIGSLVNLECDLVGKYIEKFIVVNTQSTNEKVSSKITMDFLIKNGF